MQMQLRDQFQVCLPSMVWSDFRQMSGNRVGLGKDDILGKLIPYLGCSDILFKYLQNCVQKHNQLQNLNSLQLKSTVIALVK